MLTSRPSAAAVGAPMKVNLKVLDDRLLQPEFALKYGTSRSAAVDLRACLVEVDSASGEFERLDGTFIIGPGARVKFGAGFAVHLDSLDDDPDQIDPQDEYFAPAGLILPRSGIGSRGIVLSNLVGLIDADYQGQVGLTIWNATAGPFTVHAMDRLCQMMIVPAFRPEYVVVESFAERTERAAGGFGSTGVA